MAEEYMKNMIVLNTFFLYKVDKSKTYHTDNLKDLKPYQIFYHDPVEVLSIVEIDDSKNTTYTDNNKARYEEYGNIKLHVLEKTLKDLNVVLEFGDYVAINRNNSYIYYSIIDNDKKNISLNKSFAGYESIFKSIECTPIDQNEISLQR